MSESTGQVLAAALRSKSVVDGEDLATLIQESAGGIIIAVFSTVDQAFRVISGRVDGQDFEKLLFAESGQLFSAEPDAVTDTFKETIVQPVTAIEASKTYYTYIAENLMYLVPVEEADEQIAV